MAPKRSRSAKEKSLSKLSDDIETDDYVAPKRSRSAKEKFRSRLLDNIETDDYVDDGRNYVDLAFIPNPQEDDTEAFDNQSSNDDPNDDNDLEDSDVFDENDVIGGDYQYFCDNYNNNQKLLEPNYNFRWQQGELQYDETIMNEQIFLSEEMKNSILRMSHVQLFELYISDDLNQYILEATLENGYELSMN